MASITEATKIVTSGYVLTLSPREAFVLLSILGDIAGSTPEVYDLYSLLNRNISTDDQDPVYILGDMLVDDKPRGSL